MSRNNFLKSHPRSKQHCIQRLWFFATSPLFPHTCSAMSHQYCRWVYVDWACKDTHAKNNLNTRRLHPSLHSTHQLSHLVPRQMNFPSITGMNNVLSPPNISWPLKTLNILTIPHTVTRSRDNTYSIWLQEHGSEYLIANGGYFNRLPKGVHLIQFQKQISNRATFLFQYIHVVMQ